MAFNAGSIAAALTLNISQFTGALSQAGQRLSRFASTMGSTFNNGSSSINNASRSANDFNNGMKDMTRIVGGILLSQAFYQAKQAIDDAVSSLVKFSSDMEQANISMEYFLGSKEKANAYVQVMQDFAAATTFSTDQVIKLSRQLMGAGFDPSQIKDVMSILNDSASATGGTPEQLDRIVLAMTQIKTNGKLAGQEVRQLAEAGIPVYQILQQQLGLTAKQMQNLGKQGINGDKAVQALLTGLEQRYKGAGARMANTLAGAWSNVKDDALIIGQNLFAGPYAALSNFVVQWKNSFDTLRDIVRKNGVGGLMEHLVPPDLQNSVRAIAASVISLGQSFAMLQKALLPVYQMIAGAFTQAFGTILPVIAAAVRSIVSFISAMLQASPAIKLLAATLGTLMIAQVVAKAMMLLWTVTQMGSICALVASAVDVLTNALRALLVALIDDPITAIIILVAGAILYIAMASDKAQSSLQGLMNKLGELMGVDMSNVLNPTETKDMSKWTDEFNKSITDSNAQLQDTGKNLQNAGDKAKKAGKAVKDKFVASFDELYQVPDQLDKVGSALDGIGTGPMPKIPDLPKLPTLPSNPVIPPPEGKPDDDKKPWWFGLPGPGKWTPPWNDWDPSQVTGMFGTITAGLADVISKTGDVFGSVWNSLTIWASKGTSFIDDAIKKLQVWGTTSEQTVATWTTNTASEVATWATGTWNAISTWTTNTAGAIATWSTNTWNAVSNWVSNTAEAIASWATSTWNTIVDWAENTGQKILDWIQKHATLIAKWKDDDNDKFNKWKDDNVTNIEDFVRKSEKDVQDWAAAMGTNVENWVTNTTSAISTWITSTESSFSGWVTSVEGSFSAWKTNVLSTLSSWATSGKASVVAFVNDAKANIVSWANATASSVTKWAGNTAGNIAAWANGAVAATAAFASNAGTNINNWIKGTSSGLSSWASGVLSYFKSMADGGMSAVNAFAKNSWSAFNSWISGTANGMYSWAETVMATLNSWAQSAWNTITKLAKAAGQAISGSFDGIGSSLNHASASIGSWVGENSSWLIPVGIGAGIVGATIATVATGGAAAPAFGLLGLETGGIVDKEQIIRVGEHNKREAVIPMENSTYMKPFSAAVANDLAEILGGSNHPGTSQTQDTRPIFYVGNLIADERSLKELYRKMNIIKQKEDIRGGAPA